jgi:TolA-binding protein
MALFKRKTPDVIDLGEHMRKKQAAEDVEVSESITSEKTASPFAIFGTPQTTSTEDSDTIDLTQTTDSPHEKKRKLARRIMDMTSKMEDLSNQIYHLQQRIEVLERKSGQQY